MRLPGLIDVHVHMREPGAIHKEDWDSGTAAALAGGFTTVLAMPNTNPPVTDAAGLAVALRAATIKARCDFGLFVGAGPDNTDQWAHLKTQIAGVKLYLDQTFGSMRLDDMTLWMDHFKAFPEALPIAVHAEGRTLAAVILMADLFQHPIHLCHVSRREEILLIRQAKDKGLPVTCEVSPHHLFLSTADIQRIGSGRSEVRPCLAAPEDQAALWEHLEIIDVFATDHAPHTLTEKDSDTPPPGFPGLETALPLLLTALHEDKLTIDDLVARLHTNPRRIFNLSEQPDTYIEVDESASWEIEAQHAFTRCGWTPFEGRAVRGKVAKVVLRGRTVFENGHLKTLPGSGRNLFPA